MTIINKPYLICLFGISLLNRISLLLLVGLGSIV
jgi:hypothetical protein